MVKKKEGLVTIQTQEAEPAEVIQLDGKGSPMSSIGNNSITSGNTSKSMVQKACIVLSTELSEEHNKIMQGKDKENQKLQDQLLARAHHRRKCKGSKSREYRSGYEGSIEKRERRENGSREKETGKRV